MIEEFIANKDDDVRAATVRTASGSLLNRTLNLLFPLEFSEKKRKPSQPKDTSVDTEQGNPKKQQTNQETVNGRPICGEAIQARQTLNKLLNTSS